MQGHRTAGGAGSVRGLGACEILRVGLQPVQLASLLDEVEERRRPLDEELHRLREACVLDPADERAARELRARTDEARQLALVRERVLATVADPPLALVGASGLVERIVGACARDAVDALAELVRQPPGPGHGERVGHAADIALAWTRSLLDCRATLGFAIEPPDG